MLCAESLGTLLKVLEEPPPRSLFSDFLDPDPGDAGLAEAERARRRKRDIDDAPANEGAAIDDLHDGAAAVIEIEHLDLGSKGQSPMGCNQTAKMRILIK